MKSRQERFSWPLRIALHSTCWRSERLQTTLKKAMDDCSPLTVCGSLYAFVTTKSAETCSWFCIGRSPLKGTAMNQLWLAVRVVRSLALAVAIVCVGMASTVLAQNADLSVSKSGPATIVADTDAEYTVAVSNFSGQTSTPTNTLTDTFPAQLTFVSATPPDGWTCTTPPVAGPNSITCTSTDAIPDESSVIITFIFHVAPDLSSDTQVTNSASISHGGSDENSENNNTSFTSTVGTPPPAPLTAGAVLISEFRLSGPGGSQDDYIELYCNRDTDCNISGISLRGYDPVNAGDFSLTFPAQTVIPARQYFLVGDSRGYSLSSYGAPNIDVALSQPPEPEPAFYFHDNEGLQLIGSDDPTVIDSVGFTGGGNQDQYVEGTGLERASSRPADQYAYVRKRTMATIGLPQDTNNNAEDFVLVSVTGTAHAGISALPVLGAPGPQGLTSPLTYSNSQVAGVLVDQTKPVDADPNRVRVGSGNSGTLSIRRSFTNNTGVTLDYLGFRVIEITTLNSPTVVNDQAQLRLISSSNTTAEVPSRGGTIPIFGTILEYSLLFPGLQPQQPNGGGLNTSVFTNFSEEGIMQPNATVDVQFLMNVVKSGGYKIYVYVEAGNSRGSITRLGSTASEARSGPTTPGKFVNVRRISKATSKPNQRTPVITPMTTTSPGRLTVPVSNTPTSARVTNAPAPRLIIINRGIAEGEEKPRRKTRVRRKSSAALKKKAEEKFAVAAEKPPN